ncbi:MAG: alpha-amylase, partial [Kiritimatiellae bacterium]|nr:alpha-amylase [Kiritimatiellia bacterium]
MTPRITVGIDALETLSAKLHELMARETPADPPYAIPGRWLDGVPGPRNVAPAAFYASVVDRFLATVPRPFTPTPPGAIPGDWSQDAIVYNLLVRYGAAYDHDRDGHVLPSPRADGWRETGTFLKAIALLPHIAALGCNAIHLLPITSIGIDGNKGDMGSAYAIRDPFALDDHLAEPALGLGPDAEFAAFVAAAHRLGIRVVVEFVFRTAAKDSAWAAEHPDWFYWIRADVPDRANPADRSESTYGAPPFTPEELKAIYDAVGQGRFGDLIPPHQTYRDFFTAPPAPETVHKVGPAWRATSRDPRTGDPVEVRIPGAFCDWGPDSDQPPWTDVTYLRLYDHPDFNYMAYNTVRMYAEQLARPENVVEPLWDRLADVIPHYQQAFGVDGIMIDMGHALPAELKRRLLDRARHNDPDFSLWAEEFNLSPAARAESINLCVGPFMQTVRNPQSFRDWLRWLEKAGVDLPFMAMAENHDTPRAAHFPGGPAYALMAQTLGAFLPGAPYLHNGIELNDPGTVNTGYDFTPEEVAQLPASKLALFSAAALAWDAPDADTLIPALSRLHALRRDHAALLRDARPGAVIPFDTADPALFAFARVNPDAPTAGL